MCMPYLGVMTPRKTDQASCQGFVAAVFCCVVYEGRSAPNAFGLTLRPAYAQ